MHTKGSQDPVNLPLWIDSWQDGVRAIAQRIGTKELCYRVWGESKSANWLSDCLNPDRAAKLDPDELIAILKIGREIGVHVLMHHICQQANYSEPQPKNPEDERAELQREFINAIKTAEAIARRLGLCVVDEPRTAGRTS